MVNCDQHTTNGLTFMPVPGYERHFKSILLGHDKLQNCMHRAHQTRDGWVVEMNVTNLHVGVCV